MSKILWKSLLFSPAILGATLMFGSSAIATETNSAKTANLEQQKAADQAQVSVTAKENTVAQAAPVNAPNSIDDIIRYSREGNRASSQVTSVSQLRDVQPTDWAFQALQSLVERYGCIEGYPDRTYRGNRALTRYEFAAGLNSCLNRIQELIAALPQGVSKEDLAALQRLQEEFAAELATLRGRVDALEARVTKVEAQQFSTTTKLKGEAIFAIADIWGGKNGQVTYRERGVNRAPFFRNRWDVEDRNNTVFQDRVRLEFQTSFTGKDILHTRIAAGNAQRWASLPATPLFAGGANSGFGTRGAGATSEGTLQYFVGSTGNNNVVLDWLAYETTFLGGSKLYLAAAGGIHSDYLDVKNPYFFDGDGGNGAISAFAQENPIYRIGGGAGGAISFGLGGLGSFLKGTSITGGYLAGGTGLTGFSIVGNAAGSANSPLNKNGLFDGNYSALGQLDLNFCDTFNLALTYVNAYHTTGSDIFDAGGGAGGRLVGTGIANLPSALLYGTGRGATPIVTNSYGVSGNLRLSKYFSVSAWGMYTDATLINRGSADIWSYGLGIALPNLGKPGNLLGLFAGIEPYVTGMNAGPRSTFSRDLPWHIEGFYKFQLTDNISLTPGVIWLMAPEQNNNNDDIFIGTLRTTFSF